jgi:hypothetical protein
MGQKRLLGKLLEIGYQAFVHCTALEGVLRLPNSLVRIGQYAFECSTSLTKVTYREDLENMRNVAFGGCTTLLLQRVGRKATGTDTI